MANDPVRHQISRSFRTTFRCRGQQSLNESPRGRADPFLNQRTIREFGIPLDIIPQRLVAGEWRLFSQQVVQQTAQGPDIHGTRVSRVELRFVDEAQYLWRHVALCSDLRAQLGLPFQCSLANPEVRDLHPYWGFLGDENVLRRSSVLCEPPGLHTCGLISRWVIPSPCSTTRLSRSCSQMCRASTSESGSG